jgi:hypothetical protein
VLPEERPGRGQQVSPFRVVFLQVYILYKFWIIIQNLSKI